jgi:hypothetical protein
MAASYRGEGSLLSQDSIFGSHSFKSRQYRVKAAEYGQLVKSSADAEESQKYQDLEDSFVALANNERSLAEAYHDTVHVAKSDRTRGEVLAAEEEQVLRCLGAAIIMQWNSLPTSLQREIFDTAGSVGKLWETAALRGQIARFPTNTTINPVASICL